MPPCFSHWFIMSLINKKSNDKQKNIETKTQNTYTQTYNIITTKHNIKNHQKKDIEYNTFVNDYILFF